MHIPVLVSIGMLGTMTFLSVGLWSALPEGTQLPVWFGLNGTPVHLVGAAAALFLLPAVMLLAIAAFMLAPKLVPQVSNSPVLYVVTWLVVILGLSIGHGLVIRQALFALSRA